MEASATAVSERAFGQTERRDRWWVGPLAVALGLAVCGGYATWAILLGRDYFVEPYLSPFYSPCLGASCPAEVRFLEFAWWPFSPAILLMWVVLGFRATCYYYRKAYYRAYFVDPPACAVGEPRHRYSGEAKFPLVLQNYHRYFLIPSIPVLGFLWYDTLKGFLFPDGFGIGIGSLVLLVNVILLSGYLFGCHALRHLVGGNVDCYSCARFGRTRHRAWRWTSIFNRQHMFWAWASLIVVCLTDLYVRLVASGTITDIRIL